ncbi:MAG: S-layer homology domain-containing protein [Phormidesmis sp.]
MTQSPFEPPNEPNLPASAESRPDERLASAGPSRPLTFDEVVALFVAFLSLGSVMVWGLTRGGLNVLGTGAAIESPRASNGIVQPFSFGLNSDTSAESGVTPTAPTPPGGADGTDSSSGPPLNGTDDRANAAGLAPGGTVVQTERPRSILDDLQAGMAGAAAGITGVAATPGGAKELPEPRTLPPVAADSAAVPLSEAATAKPKEAIVFEDVPDNYWAKPYIDALSSRELISGYQDGTFKPDQPVTRAQIANIVSRTFDLTADKKSLEFSDVSSDYWARESIGEVVKGGFMTGFPNNTFAPNSPVTRAQSLTTLVTGLGIKPPTNIQTSLDRYTDANAVPNWATEKVAAATAGGLVVNYPTLQQLNPTQPTTRAELSAFIYQALAKEGIVEPVESAYVVKP